MITQREFVTVEQVASADGLSNTFMFGETIGLNSFEIATSRRQTWVSGGVANGRGFVPWGQNGSLIGTQRESSSVGFGSGHTFGGNFVRGDGSVGLISRRIDWQPYYNLCGAFDTQAP